METTFSAPVHHKEKLGARMVCEFGRNYNERHYKVQIGTRIATGLAGFILGVFVTLVVLVPVLIYLGNLTDVLMRIR